MAIVYAVLAGLCWGVGEVFTKTVLASKQIGPMGVMVARFVVPVPLVVAAFWYFSRRVKTEPWEVWRAETPVILKLVLGTSLIAAFGGVFFFLRALSLAEVSRVKPIAFTIAPAAAVLLGWLVLREPMTARKAAGVVLILSGVVFLSGK